MHTVVRIYSGKGAAETIDLIIANKKDVKKLMHSVKGFIDYTVVKTEGGGFSVTVSKTEKASEAITAAAAASGITIPEVDWFVPHQANKRIIDGTGRAFGVTLTLNGLFEKAGIPRAGYDFSDGSGMSTYNRISPRAAVALPSISCALIGRSPSCRG